jgi:hypothetical protein
MKLLNYLAAAVLAAACSHAAGENVNASFALNGSPPLQTGAYSVTHMQSGAFTDTITFTPGVGFSFVDASLITIGLDATSNNGGLVEMAAVYHADALGILQITVNGWAGPAGGGSGLPINAVYAGTLNVLAVPEPATYGMLIGGLAVLAWLARRRREQDGTADGWAAARLDGW